MHEVRRAGAIQKSQRHDDAEPHRGTVTVDEPHYFK